MQKNPLTIRGRVRFLLRRLDEPKGPAGGEDGSSVDPNLRLINTTPINLDQQIDDPVTSGGDIVIGDLPGGSN